MVYHVFACEQTIKQHINDQIITCLNVVSSHTDAVWQVVYTPAALIGQQYDEDYFPTSEQDSLYLGLPLLWQCRDYSSFEVFETNQPLRVSMLIQWSVYNLINQFQFNNNSNMIQIIPYHSWLSLKTKQKHVIAFHTTPTIQYPTTCYRITTSI